MWKVMVVAKDTKNRCMNTCPHYPKKMVGSVECRGCTHHKKHNKANSVVWCAYEEVLRDREEVR